MTSRLPPIIAPYFTSADWESSEKVGKDHARLAVGFIACRLKHVQASSYITAGDVCELLGLASNQSFDSLFLVDSTHNDFDTCRALFNHEDQCKIAYNTSAGTCNLHAYAGE